MLTATKDIVLPTSIIGSLPRPAWYTQNLGRNSFLAAMTNSNYREQYIDAVSVYLRDQECAGLDILTDGDAHYDEEVCGQSWTTYPIYHMDGFSRELEQPVQPHAMAVKFPPGHILHDYLESRIIPRLSGPVGRGNLQYAPMWKTAQRLTKKPVKFGTITAEILAMSIQDDHYKDVRERVMAFSDALNAELTELVAAGCPVIQMEEPQIHMYAARGVKDGPITPDFLVEVFNNTVKGLREKAEVWCHTCWGNPAQQRMFDEVQKYEPSLEYYNQIDADLITFESCSSGRAELDVIGERIKGMKIGVGVIDHHGLQVERPEEVADHIREALKHIPAERLVVVSDCGMGREGMSRRHARYKIAALVQGTNIVRKEIGAPEAECLMTEPRYSLTKRQEA
ncbi:MAG: cobalamin-independent methionine synthase II family protein [bacterium]|nr:cobalamin-independent methionine synthase II family protein [bacterium]